MARIGQKGLRKRVMWTFVKRSLFVVWTAWFSFFQLTLPALAQGLSNASINSKVQQSLNRGHIDVNNLMLNTTPGADPLQQSTINPNQLLNKTNPFEITSSISVHILGDVKFPGVYASKVSDRAADILRLAQPIRLTTRVIEVRHADGKKETFDLYRYYYSGDLSQNPYLQDGDVVFVPQKRGIVRVEGAVTRNGEFELLYEKNLQQVLKLVGGFSNGVSRESPLKVIRFSEQSQKSVESVENNETSLKNFLINSGDIIIVPDLVTSAKQFDYSVESIPGEKPFYPTSTPQIFVMGEVLNPGPYPYKPNLTVKDYVAFAGPNVDAKLGHVTVMRANKRKRHGFDSELQSGDIVIVKQKIRPMRLVSMASSTLALVLTLVILDDKLSH